MRTLQPQIATRIRNIVKCRRKPSLHVSATGERGSFQPYSKKYEKGVPCPMNLAQIHKLSHEMNGDIIECLLSTPEYLVGIGSFDYNDTLVELHLIDPDTGLLILHAGISVPAIPAINS